MYIATIPNRNSPPAILLRQAYRENGNRTLGPIFGLLYVLKQIADAFVTPLPSATRLSASWPSSSSWRACLIKDLGYAAEVWTRSALARHVREHARKAGNIPRRPALRKRRCTEFSPNNRRIRRRSNTTWNCATLNSKPKCARCC